jgi:hypothetical protein
MGEAASGAGKRPLGAMRRARDTAEMEAASG